MNCGADESNKIKTRWIDLISVHKMTKYESIINI